MKLAYTIIYVPNVALALDFYEAAFGLQRTFLHESGEYGELSTGEVKLAFASESLVSTCHSFRPNRPHEAPVGAEIGFVTEDVAGAYAHAISQGASGYVAPHAKPWGQTVAYVRDLNGFLVELCTEVSA